MAFYLLSYGVLLWWSGRRFRDSDDPWFYGAALCSVLGYFVGVQFLSDHPAVTPYLWMLAGLVVGRRDGPEALPQPPQGGPEAPQCPRGPADDGVGRRGGRLRAVLSCLAVLLAAAVSVTSTVYAVRFLLADRHYYLARELGKDPVDTVAELDPVMDELRRAVSLNPLNNDYLTPLVQLLLTQAEQARSTGPAWEAVVLAREGISRYPTNSRAFVLLGSAYVYVYLFSGEEGYKRTALQQYETALELYPYCQDAERALAFLESR